MSSVAAPVRDLSGKAYAAISVAAPTLVLRQARAHLPVAHLRGPPALAHGRRLTEAPPPTCGVRSSGTSETSTRAPAYRSQQEEHVTVPHRRTDEGSCAWTRPLGQRRPTGCWRPTAPGAHRPADNDLPGHRPRDAYAIQLLQMAELQRRGARSRDTRWA